MKGAARWDPVAVFDLEGQLVALIGCPYMIKSRFRWPGASPFQACGAQASLYRFPDPFGFRSYCEEDHVCVLSQYSIPGLLPRLKGPTD